MTNVIGNGAHRFKVIYVEKAHAALRDLVARAKAAGRAGILLDAVTKLDRRLKRQATNLGEPLYTLKTARIEMRIGGAEFLMVKFGVHLDRNLVFVMDCNVLGDSGF